MKTRFPLLALALGLVLSANKCADDPGATAAAMQGKWVLTSLNGAPPAMPAGTDVPWFSVDSTGQQINGYAGCNRMFGPVAIHGDSISFAGLASTRMYCQDRQQVEDAFLGALRSTNTFTVKDGHLTLLGGGKELAVLERVQ